MKDLETFLNEKLSKKTTTHHLEVYAKLKQFIDSVLSTSNSQNLEERSKTMFTGLQTIRDLIVGEMTEDVFLTTISSLIEQHKKSREVEEKDIEMLASQGVSKKNLSQESQ